MYTVGLDALLFFILFSQFVFIAGRSEVGTSASLLSFKTYEGTRGEAPVDRTKEILFGSGLGDGQLEMAPRSVNARFGFTQALGQKDYFESVCTSLSTLCSAKYRVHSHVDKRTGKTYSSLSFWTKSLPMLTEFYHLFYHNKVKIIPRDLSLLTPLALAHLIMQDGSRGTSRGLYICTDSFTLADVKRLAGYLTERYEIRCSVHKSNGNHRVYILAKSVQTVRDLVLPYMHDSMLYKLGI
jgi:hypothetical protein